MKEIKNWLELKIKLWPEKKEITFKRGEIWWCSLGFNVGEEIFGKGDKFTRPVLVFKKFTSNSFLGLPFTTHGRKGSWYVEIETKGVKRWALLNQARILDKKRLTSKIGQIGDTDFQRVKRSFFGVLWFLKIVIPPCGGNHRVSPNLFNYSK